MITFSQLGEKAGGANTEYENFSGLSGKITLVAEWMKEQKFKKEQMKKIKIIKKIPFCLPIMSVTRNIFK